MADYGTGRVEAKELYCLTAGIVAGGDLGDHLGRQYLPPGQERGQADREHQEEEEPRRHAERRRRQTARGMKEE